MVNTLIGGTSGIVLFLAAIMAMIAIVATVPLTIALALTNTKRAIGGAGFLGGIMMVLAFIAWDLWSNIGRAGLWSIIGLVMVLAVLVFFEIGAIGVVIDQWKQNQPRQRPDHGKI